MQLQLTHDLQQLFMQAAMLNGQSLADFVLRSAKEKAEQIVSSKQNTLNADSIVLPNADFDELVAYLNSDPAEPNEALKEAFAVYQRHSISKTKIS